VSLRGAPDPQCIGEIRSAASIDHSCRRAKRAPWRNAFPNYVFPAFAEAPTLHGTLSFARPEAVMRRTISSLLCAVLLLSGVTALADEYTDTIELFKKAGESAQFFDKAYGYAVFPTIGKGGLVVGAAHGDGRVFRQGKYVGDTSVTQVNVGLQAGGQAFSEIIFFEDERAFNEFTRGNFELSADVSAVAITAGASAQASTGGGTGAGASGGKRDAVTAGGFTRGLAVFTIVKGGAMYQVTVGGQKFTFRPKSA
jgi:Las17-binding protein actin regulator